MTNDLSIFFKEVFLELKKISWPRKSDFLINIFATLFIVVVFSIYLGLADTVIGLVITKMIYTLL
jgi:preprotein translocase SecE subunit